MKTAIDVAVFLLGSALIGLILQDAFEVMLLPRRVRRRYRITRTYFDYGWTLWTFLVRDGRRQADRERVLSLFGPVSMVILFAIWTLGLLLGFSLIFWGIERAYDGAHSFAAYLYMSGVTLLTLGYGDITPQTWATKAIAIAEAAAGFGMLAVVIGYLPVLYQLFSRREVAVIKLDGRAGSPPTGVALLEKHAAGNALTKLDELLREWEHWSAELVESHLSYPMLSFYRSQHDNQSWLAALAAITDASVIVMVGVKSVAPFQASMTFSMARLALVEVCRVLSLSPYAGEIERLEAGDFAELKETLDACDLPFLEPNEAEASLAEFRSTYEPYLRSLSAYLMMKLPGFLPTKAESEALDNWQRSPRGRSAKALVAEVQGVQTGS